MRLKVVVGFVCLGGVAIAQPEPPVEHGQEESVSDGTATVRGRVIDALGRPVRGAKVSVEGERKSVVTGRDGAFLLAAPIGGTLVIESGDDVGIATVTGDALDDVVVTAGTTSETIEVRGEVPPATAGAAKLDRQELQRLPGTGGDVVRALTVMPGVVNMQMPLGYSGVAIRGSSPQDSKVLVDDFEIPMLFHNIAFRSILPAESLESMEFLPGGFDVSFGRASSGVVLLTTRPGSDRRTAQAEVSMIDGGLLAQGRIGKRTRYMFGLRRSTIDFVLPSLLPGGLDLSLTTVPSYYDEQFRIDHQLNSKWRLALSSVGTIDTFELYTTKNTDSPTKRFFNRNRFIRLTGSASYHDGPWSAKLALSGIAPEFVFEFGANQYIRVLQPTVTARAEATRTWDKALGLTNVEWRNGAEAHVGRTSLEMASPNDIREGEPFMGYDPRDTSASFHGTYWTPDLAAWSSVSANVDPRIRVTLGARTDAFLRSGEVAVQPRGEVKAKLTSSLTARLSSGAYRRPAEHQNENMFPNARSEHATQNIVGLEYQPYEGVRVQASGYYTDRTKLLTREMASAELVNAGRGTSVGGELLATYRGGPWFGWLSYSYSHSMRIDRPGDQERLFSFDQPHNLNAAVSWKSGRWQLGGRFQLYSGLPYTPAMGSIYDGDRNIYIPVYGEPNSERAPMHHQLDLRLDYSWNWGPAALTAFLDVQNVYMNKSVVMYYYGYDFTQRGSFNALPIIPSFGLRGVL